MLPDYDFCRNSFEKYELMLTYEMYEKFDIYAQFLVEYNKNVNLTAITEPNDILFKHFIDSALMLKYADISDNSSIIDVGTGAGFPSLPIAICNNSLKITLLDSLNKRITFLQLLCEKLDIQAEFIHGRAEDISKLTEYRERFDVSCARAVANMALLSELCIPFVKVGGKFVAMKGPNEDISLGYNAVSVLGGNVSCETNYQLEDEQRKIVVVNKISQTRTKYPRNSSQIKKKTL